MSRTRLHLNSRHHQMKSPRNLKIHDTRSHVISRSTGVQMKKSQRITQDQESKNHLKTQKEKNQMKKLSIVVFEDLKMT
jgi:hypothetical protein